MGIGATAVGPAISHEDVDYQWDVFISYSTADRPWIQDELLGPLEKAGLKACIDYRDFTPGVATLVNIEEAIEKSRHVLLVMTPNWVNGDWTSFEGLLTQTADPANRRRRLLPLMLHPCDPPRFITFLTYIDLTKQEIYAEQIAQLFRALAAPVPAQEAFPARDQTQAKATQSARNGFMILSELATRPEVLQYVVGYRVLFTQITGQIQRLGKYKDLHDRLHDLQRLCYKPLRDELRQFPGEDGRETLDEAEVTLETNIDRLQKITDGVDYLDGENAWIRQLGECRQSLHDAIAGNNLDQLKRAEWNLRRVLSVQPPQINRRLTGAAGAMPFKQLVASMSELFKKISANRLEAGKLAQFENGVHALDRLNCALDVLVKSHDRWQAVDAEIRRIEGEMQHGPEDLGFAWQDLRKATDALCAQSVEAWAASLQQDTAALQSAIDANDPVKTQSGFRRYCSRIGNQFYIVDYTLRELCGDLRQVGESLDAVLNAITPLP